MLFSVCKLGFTCFSKIFPLQNYQRSRWDVDWSAFSLHQRRTLDPCHAIGSPAFSCAPKNPRFGSNMGQIQIFPVQKFSMHQMKTRFANLENYLCPAGPTSGTPPHRAPFKTRQQSAAQEKRKLAGLIARLYLTITRPFQPKLTKIFEDVWYVDFFLQSKFHVFSENHLAWTF